MFIILGIYNFHKENLKVKDIGNKKTNSKALFMKVISYFEFCKFNFAEVIYLVFSQSMQVSLTKANGCISDSNWYVFSLLCNIIIGKKLLEVFYSNSFKDAITNFY